MMLEELKWNREFFCQEARVLLEPLAHCKNIREVREQLFLTIDNFLLDPRLSQGECRVDTFAITRDCARVLRGMLRERSDRQAGFSVAQVLWDLAQGRERDELECGFFAELTHLVRGLEGRAETCRLLSLSGTCQELSGREAAQARSDELDQIAGRMQEFMERYHDGLAPEAQQRRQVRQAEVQQALGATPQEWEDWEWQVKHVITTHEQLQRVIKADGQELEAASQASQGGVPFGITPYYAALMDNDPEAGRDTALRAQVLPPRVYVKEMVAAQHDSGCDLDFMREGDTSPIDLITRRYPGIAIFKPFNTCPQICVYCQRNWEIDQAMAKGALASREKIEAACQWLEEHPAVREVLITGGDPLAMADQEIRWIFQRVAAISHVDMIRIGSRVPVTLPMRITPDLAEFLGSLREPGVREVALSTHVQHPYEITPELITAVARLRAQGIAVYNQLVYTFFISRRFEATRLRQLLRLVGIDPYYTFAPKGKHETQLYQVPLARILQEQKEEARLLPGTRRTDEVVYNVPGLGKNYLRALQHRDLISIMPDGARVYEFHPWEKNIVKSSSYVGVDIPLIEYLTRVAEIGENPGDYASIWYYF